MSDLAAISAKLDDVLQRLDAPAQRFLSVAEAAKYTSLSSDSIRHAIASGALQACRPVRGRLVIDRKAIDAWIQGSAGRTLRRGRGK